MPWGRIASGLALLLAVPVTLAQPARAEDGCSILERVVQESVYRAATEYKRALPQRQTDSSFQRGVLAYRQACLRTVEVTTGAFTRALTELGLPIRWSPPHPGDFCRSGNLGQCYPRSRPGEPALPPHQLAFVHDAWKGVQDAVISHMRPGSSGGVSTFTEESLEASLWSNLQLAAGPLLPGLRRY